MKDEIKNRFEEYFAALQSEADRAQAAEEARIQREEDGVRQFLELIDNVIKPTLSEMAAYLNDKGIKTEIIVHGPRNNDRGIVAQHGVEARFPAAMKTGVTEPPHFKLTYNKAEQIVTLFRRTNNYNLPGERMTMDKVTREFLEEEFSKFFVKGL